MNTLIHTKKPHDSHHIYLITVHLFHRIMVVVVDDAAACCLCVVFLPSLLKSLVATNCLCIHLCLGFGFSLYFPPNVYIYRLFEGFLYIYTFSFVGKANECAIWLRETSQTVSIRSSSVLLINSISVFLHSPSL